MYSFFRKRVLNPLALEALLLICMINISANFASPLEADISNVLDEMKRSNGDLLRDGNLEKSVVVVGEEDVHGFDRTGLPREGIVMSVGQMPSFIREDETIKMRGQDSTQTSISKEAQPPTVAPPVTVEQLVRLQLGTGERDLDLERQIADDLKGMHPFDSLRVLYGAYVPPSSLVRHEDKPNTHLIGPKSDSAKEDLVPETYQLKTDDVGTDDTTSNIDLNDWHPFYRLRILSGALVPKEAGFEKHARTARARRAVKFGNAHWLQKSRARSKPLAVPNYKTNKNLVPKNKGQWGPASNFVKKEDEGNSTEGPKIINLRVPPPSKKKKTGYGPHWTKAYLAKKKMLENAGAQIARIKAQAAKSRAKPKPKPSYTSRYAAMLQQARMNAKRRGMTIPSSSRGGRKPAPRRPSASMQRWLAERKRQQAIRAKKPQPKRMLSGGVRSYKSFRGKRSSDEDRQV